MEEYIVEWRLTISRPNFGTVPQSNWDKYPWLPIFVDAALATEKAEEAATEWNHKLENTSSQYEFRVRHTTTEFIKIV